MPPVNGCRGCGGGCVSDKDGPRPDLSDRQMTGIYFMAYLLPLVGLILGYFIGAWLGGETAGIAAGLLFLVISFWLVRLFDRRFRSGVKYRD